MTLQATVLASRLDTLIANTDNEAAAAAALAQAFADYFVGGSPPNPATGAIAGAVPVTPAGPLGTPRTTMQSALTGMSAPNAGAAILASAISAFWTAMAGAAATCFAGATAITPPPGLAGLAATLTATFTANKTLSKTAALQAIANDIHAANAGGIATFPNPVGPQTIS